jgi:asparagine synthase (glutamine-hydrolysing)
MKLQFGIVCRDAALTEKPATLEIFSELRNCRADIANDFRHGPLTISYRGNRITEEEENETQPLCYGPYVLTFDGRLDNRKDLALKLGIPDSRTPDPLLVVKIYDLLGDATFSNLIGEYALALWDRKHKSIRFVRSVCGSRPLYYTFTDTLLLWCSDFAHLVKTDGRHLTINDSYLLEYLASQPHYRHTPFHDIKTVPPGTIVCFTATFEQRSSCFWNCNEVPPLQLENDMAYESRLRDLLSEAVQAKLRTKYAAFSELSGGLDSSTLVLMTDTIRLSTPDSLPTLHTVSCVYEESETCDERYFIRSVEEKRRIATLQIPEQSQAITLGLNETAFSGLPTPFDCFPGRLRSYKAQMAQYKAGVLISGEGGDHLFWSIRDGTPVVANHLANWQLLKAHRESIAWSRVTAVPYLQLLHRSIHLALGALYQPNQPPVWLGNDFKQRFSAEIWDSATNQGFSENPAFAAHARLIEALRCQLAAGYTASSHLYISYPYTYRPLLEFCLGLPTDQLLRSGKTRSLMRRALRDLLPPQILGRQSKASADEGIVRALNREWHEISDVSRWEISRRGFIDPGRFQEDLRLMRLGIISNRGNFLRAFSLERWLRSLTRVRHGERTKPSPLITQSSQFNDVLGGVTTER